MNYFYIPPVIRSKLSKFLSLYWRGDFISLSEFATALEDIAECARSIDSALHNAIEEEVNKAVKNPVI